MSHNLLFEFTVDKEIKTIVILREFQASLELVWKAWTTAPLLDLWCAPNPYRIETKTMNFKDGGFWHYALVSPSGEKHWSRYDYKKIEINKSITEHRVFSDEKGAVNPGFSPTECTIVFRNINGRTRVTITERYGSEVMFEKMANDSHRKGFSSHLKNLDRLLSTLKT